MLVKALYDQPGGATAMMTAMSETIHAGPVAITFVLEAAQTGGALTAFECAVPAAAMVAAPHSHDAFEETIYGLAGRITFTVEGTEHEVGPGDAVFIPRGAVHGFVNRGDSEARFLAVTTPGLLGPDYFREVGDVVRAAAGGPPDLDAVRDVMRRHGLTPAG
jgi:quercetin dioxygenase-like cupin family protein